MCLRRVTKTYPRGRSGVGYKVFVALKKTLGSECQGQRRYVPGKWYKSRPPKNFKYIYPLDFHIFLRKKDAESWLRMGAPDDKHEQVVHKVEYRGAHTIGSQRVGWASLDTVGPCVVAPEMKILNRVA